MDPRPSPERTADCSDELYAILTGGHPREVRRRHLFGRLPSNPRCILCYAPFGAPGSLVMRALGRSQFAKNPKLCERCFAAMSADPGGCEVEISVLFVDVRGSTSLAERLGAAAYADLLARYYRVATEEMVAGQAFIEITGDEVYGFYLPAFTPGNPTRVAIETAERILRRVTDVEIGAGIHLGSAWVGVVGDPNRVSDFRSIGDPVNVGARLVSAAGPGECLISEVASGHAHLEWANLFPRQVTAAGKTEPILARVMTVGSEHRQDER